MINVLLSSTAGLLLTFAFAGATLLCSNVVKSIFYFFPLVAKAIN